MTTTHQRYTVMSKSANDALIDQLRACQTRDEILVPSCVYVHFLPMDTKHPDNNTDTAINNIIFFIFI